MIGQNFNGLPNGRMVVACLACGWKHDLSKFNWQSTVCQNCRKIINHPIARIKTSKTRGIKTNLMLNKNARDFLYTIAEIHECSQSEALNMILKFACDEYKAGGSMIMSNPKDQKHWAKELLK